MSEVRNIKLVNIELDRLNIRYIPVITPYTDMRLTHSPHVELMQIFKEHGLEWSLIVDSRYYKERQLRFELGINKWTENKIRSHIKDRYEIYRRVTKYGLKRKLLNADPIRVLRKPFWNTRFGLDISGYEIWNGAGRCSASYVAGHNKIRVMICEDKRPGTGIKGKFADKLKGVEGVWND